MYYRSYLQAKHDLPTNHKKKECDFEGFLKIKKNIKA